MHLLAAQAGTVSDGSAAVDLRQTPGDIIVLSAADSDLAAFGAAHATLPKDFPSVRLTNLLALGHPASVDLYVERTLRDARIVVLRMLGGESYWPHGVESLRSDALRRGALLACIPGELSWDARLAARGTLNTIDTHALWRYCTEGGVENAELALRFAAHLIGRGDLPAPARPMPSAGFWRGEPAIDDRPNAVVICYRALVAGGNTAVIDAFIIARYKEKATKARQYGLIKKDVDVDSWIEPKYLNQALKDLGLERYWPQYDADGKKTADGTVEQQKQAAAQ